MNNKNKSTKEALTIVFVASEMSKCKFVVPALGYDEEPTTMKVERRKSVKYTVHILPI